MSEALEDYFDLNKIKDYPEQPWENSDDVACYGVPCDEGISLMPIADAIAFLANNDICSLIAFRIPKEKYDECQAQDCDHYNFEIKDEYYLDYQGKSLI